MPLYKAVGDLYHSSKSNANHLICDYVKRLRIYDGQKRQHCNNEIIHDIHMYRNYMNVYCSQWVSQLKLPLIQHG